MAQDNPLVPFHFNAGSVMVPRDWQDVSILVLNSPDDKNGSSFTLSRDILPWGLDFAQFAQREIISLSQQLKNYQMVSQESGQLNGWETVTLEFAWSSPQGPIHQVMMLLNLPEQVLIFTGTCNGEMTSVQREKMLAMMTSFQPRIDDRK
ncbi:DcrB-related protein [Photorhabdus asymbiotica]|uniref:DcrB-related protein n=1 Tax=Photorhabdus asymbiotica TaxID=291112 RepID=UPI003DA728AF